MRFSLLALPAMLILGLSLAGCGDSHTGRFVDPAGAAIITIQGNGTITNNMGTKMRYTVTRTTEAGTTLKVVNDPPDSWSAEWTVTKDGKELHGASSPAKVVFRRQ